MIEKLNSLQILQTSSDWEECIPEDIFEKTYDKIKNE